MIGFEKFFLKNIGKEEIKNLSLHPFSFRGGGYY